jgi:hypothetical protein
MYPNAFTSSGVVSWTGAAVLGGAAGGYRSLFEKFLSKLFG